MTPSQGPSDARHAERPPLRRGWTTGACATAATRSALHRLLYGEFLDPVSITLPGGQTPSFALERARCENGQARAGIIKDAGDDPDVTHGATIMSEVYLGAPDSGILFRAGQGVGTVTRPGLPVGVGEAAINPVPRSMMEKEVRQLCAAAGVPADVTITISVPGGEELARRTWNPRLGIVGGLSILGTTGIVIPYSCSAWIHSIHSGIDVARASGISHLVGATGERSETAARRLLNLPPESYIDMGDFAGGMLKYLQRHPVKRLTIAGGFAKMSKLAGGAMDLHSARSQVDLDGLAAQMAAIGATPDIVRSCRAAASANGVLLLAEKNSLAIGDHIARLAAQKVHAMLKRTETDVSILIVNRKGAIVGRALYEGALTVAEALQALT